MLVDNYSGSRNHRGEVLTSSAQRVESAFSALIAEAFGVLHGLVFARDSGLLPAIVESDALGFVNVVNTAPTLADLGLIVLDIQNILALYPDCSVMFVPRFTNQAAHCMARNHWGEVLASSAQRVESAFLALIAEALGVLCGLVFVRDPGLLPPIVESDALRFANVVNTPPTLAYLGLIVLDIQNVLALYLSSCVMFVALYESGCPLCG
ncbi:hypothetical protein ACOSQ3_014025 [Xanthoceras sorbifolium]